MLEGFFRRANEGDFKMKETVLKTDLRTGSPKQVRAEGFIPGVLHGPGTQSASVQFEKSAFIRILTKHGSNAKVWIELNKEKHFGILKEIQKDPLDKSIIHVTFHLVEQNQEIKMIVPVVFNGRDDLENRFLMLQTLKEHVEVSGKASSMPESIVVDVTGKQLNDFVTTSDLVLPKNVRILSSENETYAHVRELRQIGVAEPETVSAEPEVPSTEAPPEKSEKTDIR
jgi:large subunit ribosomal protein L25